MGKYQYDKQELKLMQEACVPFAVYQFLEGRVVTLALSQGFLDLFDLSDNKAACQLMDNDMYRDCHPDDIAPLEEAAILFATKDAPYDVVYRSKVHGNYRLIHAWGKHIFKGGVKIAVVWYADEGECGTDGDSLNASYFNLFLGNETDRKAKYDYLTGLPTVSYFFYLIDTNFYKNTIKAGQTPTMLFLDFNGMKYFNAKFGFSEGDKLIQAFTHLLSQTFGSDCCCRFGMDRFCVYTSAKDLEDRLWKLFADVENINGGKSLPVRAGVYSSKVEECGAATACDRAKFACDSVKSYAVSRFAYFDSSMLQTEATRRYIINNVDNAISQGWIQVYYQPIIRASNNRVCDEEALSRWVDPVKGFLSPADFIPILEEAKLIYKTDLYVAEQVLQKIKEQTKQGLHVVPISINLSRSDFESCDIVTEIDKRVKAAGLPPEKLTIEITESVVGSDYEYMKSQIKRFQALGYNIWMDDFGSGYSSLEVLSDIHFSLIKFDMKFMQQFHSNPKNKIILSGLMKTATNLGIDTICEGVETEDQVEFLKEIGCAKMQGYYFCKPIPKNEIFERYEKGTQIGFENPAETDYYASLGKVNLHDLSFITNSDEEHYKNFFSTPPMVIIECNQKEIWAVRGNKSYREFVKKYFNHRIMESPIDFKNPSSRKYALFFGAIEKCRDNPAPAIIDLKLGDGSNVHIFIKRISVNPVTKVCGLAVAVLGVAGV